MPHHIQLAAEGIARISTHSTAPQTKVVMTRTGRVTTRLMANNARRAKSMVKRSIYVKQASVPRIPRAKDLQNTVAANFIKTKVNALFGGRVSGLTIREVYSKNCQYSDSKEGLTIGILNLKKLKKNTERTLAEGKKKKR